MSFKSLAVLFGIICILAFVVAYFTRPVSMSRSTPSEIESIEKNRMTSKGKNFWYMHNSRFYY